MAIAKHWSVTVEVDVERVLCISDQHYAGVPDIERHADTVRNCADHLRAFVGASDDTVDAVPGFDAQTCRTCGGPIPAASAYVTRDSVYCSRGCVRAANRS